MLSLIPHYVFKRNVLAYLGYVGWLVALLFKFREECFYLVYRNGVSGKTATVTNVNIVL
jgi:hypothetical protein